MTLIVEHPAGWEPERRYILDVMLTEFLGLTFRSKIADRQDVQVTLHGDSDKTLVIADVFFSLPERERLRPTSLASLPLQRLSNAECGWDVRTPHSDVPSIFTAEAGQPWCETNEGHISIALDIFGSAFYLLSRYEEVVSDSSDAHGRFPYSSSCLADGDLVTRPLVNEYLELLWGAIHHLWPGLSRRPRDYRVLLSHDVDSPMVTLGVPWKAIAKAGARDLIKNRDLQLATRRVLSRAAIQAGHFSGDMGYSFDSLMDIAESRGIQSAFYFIAGGTDPQRDAKYTLDHPQIRTLLETIHGRGHEIGLHPSYNSYSDAHQIELEFATLRASCEALGIIQQDWGGRQHYLRWSAPETWQHWDDAGLNYDSTIGFAGHVGFRAGTCYEYPVFNLQRRQALELRERPLVVMDVTLFGVLSPQYMNRSDEDGLRMIEGLVRECRTYDGDFTLLWHNDRVLTSRTKSLFSRSLEIATQN